MKIKTIDHGYLKFILLLILMIIFDYIMFISIDPFDYGLILTKIILLLQYIPITIFNINLFRKGIQYATRNEVYLIFSLFIALNAIYVSKLFHRGVYYVLFTNAPILPSMRTSAAIMMLNDGHIDIIDPHYLFPSEYIIVWLISKAAGLSASVSYVIVFGFMKMLLWVSILLILVKIFLIPLMKTNQVVISHHIINFLFILMILLFIFKPTGFYLDEFSIATPLFLLLAVTVIKIGLNNKVLSYTDIIILLLVALGILINSIRDTIALLMVSILVVLFALITRKNLGPVRYVFYLAIILSLARLIYFGMQYLTGYVGYVAYLYNALLTALTVGFDVKRPPLHTVITTPSNIVDKVLNFAGSLVLFILLIVLTILSLIGAYRSLREINNTLITGFALSIFLSFIVVIGVAALAYIINISGYFNLDFETFFALIPYLYIIPLLYVLIMNVSDKYKPKYNNLFTYKFVISIIILIILFSSLFSTFGLASRAIIRSQTDLNMIHNNPATATLYVNQLYMFITEYYSKSNIYIGNSTFLQLYLTLPLTYRGITPINYVYLCNLSLSNNLIYYDQLFYISLINNNYILCGLKVILPY